MAPKKAAKKAATAPKTAPKRKASPGPKPTPKPSVTPKQSSDAGDARSVVMIIPPAPEPRPPPPPHMKVYWDAFFNESGKRKADEMQGEAPSSSAAPIAAAPDAPDGGQLHTGPLVPVLSAEPGGDRDLPMSAPASAPEEPAAGSPRASGEPGGEDLPTTAPPAASGGDGSGDRSTAPATPRASEELGGEDRPTAPVPASGGHDDTDLDAASAAAGSCDSCDEGLDSGKDAAGMSDEDTWLEELSMSLGLADNFANGLQSLDSMAKEQVRLLVNAVGREALVASVGGMPKTVVENLFMCEIATYKQKFLKQTILADKFPLEDLKLSVDASALSIFCAGFSCKHLGKALVLECWSFSRMNNDFESLKRAMADEKDCSSVATFRGVCQVLAECSPMCFILENVDSLETSDDELQTVEKKSSAAADSEKWKELHSTMAEQCGDLKAVCFIELWNERRDDSSKYVYVDISQSLSRMQSVTSGSGADNPSGHTLVERKACTGPESIRMSAPVIMAAVLSVVSSVRYMTDSESEELDDISSRRLGSIYSQWLSVSLKLFDDCTSQFRTVIAVKLRRAPMADGKKASVIALCTAPCEAELATRWRLVNARHVVAATISPDEEALDTRYPLSTIEVWPFSCYLAELLPSALVENGHARAAQSTRFFCQGDYESCFLVSKQVLEEELLRMAADAADLRNDYTHCEGQLAANDDECPYWRCIGHDNFTERMLMRRRGKTWVAHPEGPLFPSGPCQFAAVDLQVTPNANLRILISDEAAIKASLCNKGASGLVFCMACQNAICFEEQFRSPDQQFGNGQPEVPAEDSSSHPRHHGFLASQQGLRPKAEFEKLQTALGFDFKPEGLLVTDCVMFDWCSTYTC
ncbi:hypothetical protein AK812_SmicGene2736 [Symbiodinium microadriaticum]|uniref:Uncharacterized protein n=1 Tax=Symbiodinium microadriaticum TaxID=2951 RepID=A0A1Q9F116_SYMMI|nr:hypothetical protein AK812_SmicGene2736 [Symbiodinium microadriaticum]